MNLKHMNWDDLEVGDVVRVVKKNVNRFFYLKGDLEIRKIYYDKGIRLYFSNTDDGEDLIILNHRGQRIGFENYGVFFKIVELKEE